MANGLRDCLLHFQHGALFILPSQQSCKMVSSPSPTPFYRWEHWGWVGGWQGFLMSHCCLSPPVPIVQWGDTNYVMSKLFIGTTRCTWSHSMRGTIFKGKFGARAIRCVGFLTGWWWAKRVTTVFWFQPSGICSHVQSEVPSGVGALAPQKNSQVWISCYSPLARKHNSALLSDDDSFVSVFLPCVSNCLVCLCSGGRPTNKERGYRTLLYLRPHAWPGHGWACTVS